MGRYFYIVVWLLLPILGAGQGKENDSQGSIAGQVEQLTSLASFYHGYARVKKGEKEYYINKQGGKAFDTVVPNANVTLGNKDDIAAYDESVKSELLPTKVIPFIKDGKWGVMNPRGEVLLKAAYDSVGVDNPYYWKLKKANEISFYLKGGKMLPFFEDVGYLDGNYFDVKQQGKWGIYSFKEQKLVIPAIFDAFDYCGGCGRKPSYVYASHNGKWGILDWNGKELLPFIYEHGHYGMRSDNWVESFTKNGKRLIVHIPTRKEFLADEQDDYPKIVAGLLLVKEIINVAHRQTVKTGNNGSMARYGIGIYGQDGEMVSPPQYEWIDEPNANSYLGYYGPYLLAKADGKMGVVDHSGKWVLPAQYDDVKVYDDHFVARKDNLAILFDKNQKELLQVNNAEITHANEYFYSNGSDGLAVFKVKQRAYYGLYFVDNARYYPPEFYDVDIKAKFDGENRDLIVGEKQGLFTVFDAHGNLLIPGQYNGFSFLESLPDSLAEIVRGKKVGLYNVKSQKEVIPPVYDHFELMGPQHELIMTTKGDYDKPAYEFWNLQGQKIIGKTFTDKDTINTQYCLLKNNQKGYSLFNVETKQVRFLDYAYVWKVGSSRLLFVSDDGRKGKLFDILEDRELGTVYDASQFNFELNGERNTTYVTLFPFKNGFAKIVKHGEYGFIDEKGKELLPPKYAKVSDFNGAGLAVVVDARKLQEMGYNNRLWPVNIIDKRGRTLLSEGYVAPDLQFSDFSELFLNDKILLFKMLSHTSELRVGLADSKGQVLLEPIYNDIIPTKNNRLLLLKKGAKFGLATFEGKIIVPVQYANMGLGNGAFYTSSDSVDMFPVPVFNDDKWFYIDETGKKLPLEAANLDDLLY
ncbi:WG repeat-containing protein [Olivibacter sp. SA151]|uniref:WG repeat-containing protein n=1 Tax=Olivibacter jilunii TaxID=985016 RepID=UPI003F18EB82